MQRARFTSHVQICIATIPVVAGCENLLRKAESSSTFCNKISTCCAFFGPKANLFATNDVTPPPPRVIFNPNKSQYSRTLQKPGSLQDRFDSWEVKCATSPFNWVSNNAAKQVACLCCPFYCSLTESTVIPALKYINYSSTSNKETN